jgi:hypothetical protein
MAWPALDPLEWDRMRVVALLAWLALLVPFTVSAYEDGWSVIGREDNVVISRRAIPGHALPAFRGKGPIRGNVDHVLAQLRNVPSINQWAYGVSRAQLLEQLAKDVDLIYLFSHTPWPMRDRDMVVRRTIETIQSGHEYRISLRCERGVRPVRDGVVRVSECESELRLRRLDDHTTEVDYWASLDPGKLPNWTSSWIARTVPGRTLAAIQRRASRR